MIFVAETIDNRGRRSKHRLCARDEAEAIISMRGYHVAKIHRITPASVILLWIGILFIPIWLFFAAMFASSPSEWVIPFWGITFSTASLFVLSIYVRRKENDSV